MGYKYLPLKKKSDGVSKGVCFDSRIPPKE